MIASFERRPSAMSVPVTMLKRITRAEIWIVINTPPPRKNQVCGSRKTVHSRPMLCALAGETPLEPVHGRPERQRQHQVDQPGEGEHLEGAVRSLVQDLGLVHQITARDGRHAR